MTTYSLFLVTCLLSLATSQIPIDLQGWTAVTPDANDPTCESIGGYDYANDRIKIYGGADVYGGGNTNKIVFNPQTGNYIVQDPSGLSTPLLTTSAHTQIIGDNADNIIYFISQDSQNISGINMIDDTVATYHMFAAGAEIYSGALCADDDTNTLYSVGQGFIQTCTQNTLACVSTEQDAIPFSKNPSCAFYDGALFVFGGQDTETITDITHTIWKCDPTVDNTCSAIPASLTTARAGMGAVKIDCFTRKYVALIGGRLSGGDPTSRVQLFDLKTETISDSQGLGSGKKSFVGVFAPVDEAIFVFGGSTNAVGDTCTNYAQVTSSGAEGLCFTSEPTMDPSESPSKNPSQSPSKSPSTNPTKAPTDEPSISPQPAPTKSPDTYDPVVPDYETSAVTYVVISVLLVIICAIILGCLWWLSREGKQDYEMAQDMVSGDATDVTVDEQGDVKGDVKGDTESAVVDTSDRTGAVAGGDEAGVETK